MSRVKHVSIEELAGNLADILNEVVSSIMAHRDPLAIRRIHEVVSRFRNDETPIFLSNIKKTR